MGRFVGFRAVSSCPRADPNRTLATVVGSTCPLPCWCSRVRKGPDPNRTPATAGGLVVCFRAGVRLGSGPFRTREHQASRSSKRAKTWVVTNVPCRWCCYSCFADRRLWFSERGQAPIGRRRLSLGRFVGFRAVSSCPQADPNRTLATVVGSTCPLPCWCSRVRKGPDPNRTPATAGGLVVCFRAGVRLGSGPFRTREHRRLGSGPSRRSEHRRLGSGPFRTSEHQTNSSMTRTGTRAVAIAPDTGRCDCA